VRNRWFAVESPVAAAAAGGVHGSHAGGNDRARPDSRGMAVFSDSVAEGRRKLSLYCAAPGFDWPRLQRSLLELLGDASFETKGNHCIVTTRADEARFVVGSPRNIQRPRAECRSQYRSLQGFGLPAEVADRYGFARMSGTHLVGHTRMATESAVTPRMLIPTRRGGLVPGAQRSLANPGSLRRKLEKLGERFESDCDTEERAVTCTGALSSGDDLETALEHAFRDFDGFFTFLMAPGTSWRWYAIRLPASRGGGRDRRIRRHRLGVSLSGPLAGIKHANVFEPKPAEVYAWSVQ